ncbi:MAG: class I SAM-dependent methyltransferase [Hyphomicrobiaceae bacterium]
MTGFSPEWLALREPVDHRSRDTGLALQLAGHFAGRDTIRIVDLGCGAGSNLRGTFASLPATQRWVLVDYDPRLLETARSTLTAWADTVAEQGDTLHLSKDGKDLHISFRQCDLNRELDDALGDAPDLVTAAAFFDLASAAFMQRLAAAIARRRAVFYTVLTYNGDQQWTPSHEADRLLCDAFHHHQLGDKGFGPSAGPRAPGVLADAFSSVGYQVREGDSPWHLTPGDQQLIADLAPGFASAAGETGRVDADTIRAWSSVPRTGAIVGHTDTLALPA